MTLKAPPDDAVGHVFREVTSAALTFSQLHKTASEVLSLLRSRRALWSMNERVFTARTQDASPCFKVPLPCWCQYWLSVSTNQEDVAIFCFSSDFISGNCEQMTQCWSQKMIRWIGRKYLRYREQPKVAALLHAFIEKLKKGQSSCSLICLLGKTKIGSL